MDVYLSPNVRHKVPRGPTHYTSVYRHLFKGLKGHETGWTKVTAEETCVKGRPEASWTSQWPTSMVH